MTDVVLSPWEVKLCVDVANARNTVSVESNRKPSANKSPDYLQSLASNVLGACGEMAFAKATATFWSPSVNTFKAVADVGDDIEVRTVEKPTYRLIVRPGDPEDRWYVLVTSDPAQFRVDRPIVFRVVGGIKGVDAKQDAWWDEPSGRDGAWFVPQNELTQLRVVKLRTEREQ